jgi:hypothetical protein
MTTFRLRHHGKKQTAVCKKTSMMEGETRQVLPPSSLHCTIENMDHHAGRKVKKSWRMKPITIRSTTNLHLPLSALQWILVLIFVYLAAGTIAVMIQDGTESLKNIVVYSIIGFFTFFMGYLGWILARDVLEIVSRKKNMQNDAKIEA